jgi:Ca-activated chloride channel family protein
VTNYFSLHARLNTTAIPVADQPRLVYLLVEIQPNPNVPPVRAPVNLVVLVDASDSMLIPSLSDELVDELGRRGLLQEGFADGIPIFRLRDLPDDLAGRAQLVRSMDYVRQAVHNLAERLTPADNFALLAFAGRAETLMHNQPGSEKRGLVAALDRLDRAMLGDETRMADGLALALAEARRGHTADHVSRVLLLTDGFTQDEAASLAVAAEMAQCGMTLSTVGVGLTFNEGFLIGLAELCGGNAHLVFERSEIPSIFATEFETSQSVLVRSLELKLTLTPGVEARRAYRVRPVLSEMRLNREQGRSLTIALGDLGRNGSAAVLLELIVPPQAPGSYRLAKLVLEGELPAQSLLARSPQRIVAQTDAVYQVVPFGQPAGALDPSVMHIVETVNAFRLHTRALADASAGDVVGATHKLEAAAARLLALGETDLAGAVRAEVSHLQTHGHMSEKGAKELRYATRQLTQRLV